MKRFFRRISNGLIFPNNVDIPENEFKTENNYSDYSSNIGKISYFKLKTTHFNMSCICYVPSDFVNDMCIVFSHGRGSTVKTIGNVLKHIGDTSKYIVFSYDYFGYGISAETTKPSEQKCYHSLNEFMEHIKNKLGFNKIKLVGYSLGTAITVNYAVENKWPDQITLIAPFTSANHVGLDQLRKKSKRIMKGGTVIVRASRFFGADSFVTINKIDKLTTPPKIFHGTDDDEIPSRHSGKIFSKIVRHNRDSLNDLDNLPGYVSKATHLDIVKKIDFSFLIEPASQTKYK